MNSLKCLLLFSLTLILSTCGSPNSKTRLSASIGDAAPATTVVATADNGPGLDPYWYQGKAEISTYDLEQVRYGQTHPGQLSLIFVTEDFLTDRQVKNDTYRNPNTTKVLKTNQLRRFTTGIYDYSIMNSVFTPVDRASMPHSLKVTTSAQDWCGHSFSQLNFKEGRTYDWMWRSYFESEGDRDEQVEANWIEDELYNLIRMGPEALPIGTQFILPPLEFMLINHLNVEGARAEATLADYSGEPLADTDKLQQYTLEYPDLGRKVEVVFGAEVPYRIEKITVTESGRRGELTSVATRQATQLLPYWELNKPEHRSLRAELQID